ncbi:MAG: helix-turn-helix domain-containing protein [Xanthomonadaceae bacterium]|nr:helix-turn-helix domain-containing protein [Xanthomonadaceae bacterium]
MRDMEDHRSPVRRSSDDASATLKTGIRDRLAGIRTKLKKSQPEMDAALDIGKRSWQRYESGTNFPGGGVVAKLVEMGFNANWILTGQGSPYRDAPDGAGISDTAGDYSLYKAPPSIDRDKIVSLILLVEERMADALPSHMKARMAADLIIQYLEGENDESK